MNDAEKKRRETYEATLRAFLALAKSAGWIMPEEQVRSLLVCICQLVEDDRLPEDTIETLFDMLEELAIAERNL